MDVFDYIVHSDDYESFRRDSEQDWAARYQDAWDRLEAHGIVDSADPEDRGLTVHDLERLVAYLGPERG